MTRSSSVLSYGGVGGCMLCYSRGPTGVSTKGLALPLPPNGPLDASIASASNASMPAAALPAAGGTVVSMRDLKAAAAAEEPLPARRNTVQFDSARFSYRSVRGGVVERSIVHIRALCVNALPMNCSRGGVSRGGGPEGWTLGILA